MQLEVQSAARVVGPDGLAVSTPAASLTPAQKRGLKYQAKVEKELERLYSGRALLRPWFRYKVENKVKRCQPDALIFDPLWAHVWIVEIKYSTIREAWNKLQNLYAPVVEKAYRIPSTLILVTRLFDPHVRFPCKINQLEGLERIHEFRAEGVALGVVSWKA